MSEVLRDFPEVNGLYIFRCEPVPLVNQVKGSVIDVFLGGLRGACLPKKERVSRVGV